MSKRLNSLRVALCESTADEARIIAETNVNPGQDVTLGANNVTLVVPQWEGPPLLLIEGGEHLHLHPGMRVNMCGEGGFEHLIGEFEELAAMGVSSPIPVRGREISIRLQVGYSVFVKQVRDASRSQLQPDALAVRDDHELESEIDALAQAGAESLSEPAIALPKLAAAHALALSAGRPGTAAELSTLMARCAARSGRLSEAIRFAHRAVGEAPAHQWALYTLGHFLELAGSQHSSRSASRRAAIFYAAAADSYDSAATSSTDDAFRSGMVRLAAENSKKASGCIGPAESPR